MLLAKTNPVLQRIHFSHTGTSNPFSNGLHGVKSHRYQQRVSKRVKVDDPIVQNICNCQNYKL